MVIKSTGFLHGKHLVCHKAAVGVWACLLRKHLSSMEAMAKHAHDSKMADSPLRIL